MAQYGSGSGVPITDRLWRGLVAAEDEAWSDLLPARNNLKPGAPPENPHVRRSVLFVRVRPNYGELG